MDTGALMQMIVSYIGEEKAANLTQQQIDIFRKQIADMRGIPLPQLPNVTPEQLGAAAQSKVYSDPALRQQEQDSLSEYGNVYNQGGLDFKSRADINELLNQAASSAQSGADSIRQHLQGTGQLGSGADIAMQMGNGQAAAQRGGEAALQTAALAEQRKMDALAAKTGLAGKMRGEDLSEKTARAQAQDARDEWNAASRSKAGYYNAGLPQQQFQNQVTKVTGGFAPGSNLAGAYANEAQGQRGFWSGMGAGAHQAMDSMGRSSGGGGGGSGGGVNSDDPNSVYRNGTNYGGSNPDEWNNPYGGY
jgi:hypothetical protein